MVADSSRETATVKRQTVPEWRLRERVSGPINRDGDFVLYWMTACHRTGWNFALERAIERYRELAKPLVVLDVLLSTDPWANERLHRFALDGMADVARRLSATNVCKYGPDNKSVGDYLADQYYLHPHPVELSRRSPISGRGPAQRQ